MSAVRSSVEVEPGRPRVRRWSGGGRGGGGGDPGARGRLEVDRREDLGKFYQVVWLSKIK